MGDNGRPLIGARDVATPEWAENLRSTSEAGILTVARRVPRTAAQLVVWSWRAAPGWTATAGVVQVLSGVVTALGLLATADVFTRLLADGPTPERVLAALPAIAVVVAALVGRGLLDAAVSAVTTVLVPLVDREVQTRLYRELVEVDLVAFDDADFTALVDQAGRAMSRIGTGTRLVGDLVGALVGVVAAVVPAALVHPLLAPVVVLAALPQAWVTMRNVQLNFASSVRLISQRRRLDVVTDLMSRRENAAEVRAYTTQDVLLDEHGRIVRSVAAEEVRVAHRQNLLSTLGRALSGVGTALGYVVLGLLLTAGGLALPLAGTAVVVLRSASQSVVGVVSRANFLFDVGLQVELYGRCLVEARERRPPGGRRGLDGGPREVTLSGVTFRYPGQAEPALRDVDLTLRRGEVVALVGENGSGKSTLAKLVVGLYRPDEGTVSWDGTATGDVDPRALHSHVALVAQEPVRWPLTARDNVRLGRLDRDDPGGSAFDDAVARSGADAVLADLPDGRDTVLSRAFQGGRDLSGGQWQRIAVARGLYRDAHLVVADEPTAALDARAEHAVFAALHELSAGRDRITVLVTHRLANVRSADRIVVLDHGRVVEQGTHDELMASGGTYRELFTLQGAAYA